MEIVLVEAVVREKKKGALLNEEAGGASGESVGGLLHKTTQLSQRYELLGS